MIPGVSSSVNNIEKMRKLAEMLKTNSMLLAIVVLTACVLWLGEEKWLEEKRRVAVIREEKTRVSVILREEKQLSEKITEEKVHLKHQFLRVTYLVEVKTLFLRSNSSSWEGICSPVPSPGRKGGSAS